MSEAIRVLTETIDAAIAAKRAFLADRRQLASFKAAVDLVIATYRRGGRLCIAGNGGSSSDAQHLAAEFVCKLLAPRPPLAAEALAADGATLTAIGNDFGFDEVFARQIECKLTDRDVFIALSTSGRSPNIVRALERCRIMGVPSILFGGSGGGRAAEMANIVIIATGENSCRVQEVHIVLYHALVACVESALFADEPPRTEVDVPALSAGMSS